ncbi:MAG: hypothetical protein EBT91_11000 [Rhodobacteraceae bacterium]|nr:hypothetical protein [Paracoccaceae bacterium]
MVSCASVLAFFVRFSSQQEDEQRAAFAVANLDTLRKRAERANADLEKALDTIEIRRGTATA